MKSYVLILSLIISTQVLALDPIAYSNCQKEYLNIFANDEINMTVAFGYDDVSEKLSNDQKSLDIFVKTLTTKCPRWGQRLCGFTLKSKSPTVLVKKVFGPDGRPRTLKVTADAASVSSDNEANRLNPLQKIQSQSVQNLFLKGLETSQVTIYMGHSRDGGGPSFAPPKLNSQGHVDYNYYHKNKVDKNLMVKSLAKSPLMSRIVALISCSSIRWFSRSIENQAPSSGIIGTTEAFTTGNFKETWPLMEKIFSYQCLSDLSIDDSSKTAKIIEEKSWQVPEKDKNLTKAELDKRTLETLARYLRSPDVSIRKEAYLEIKSYNQRLYTPMVLRELKSYTFSNTFSKNF